MFSLPRAYELPTAIRFSITCDESNAAPMDGGTRTETPLVTKADVTQARKALAAQLDTAFADAVDAVVAGVSGDRTVFTATASLGEAVESVDTTALVGSEVPEFELGLEATGSVLVVDPSPIEEIARAQGTWYVGET